MIAKFVQSKSFSSCRQKREGDGLNCMGGKEKNHCQVIGEFRFLTPYQEKQEFSYIRKPCFSVKESNMSFSDTLCARKAVNDIRERNSLGSLLREPRVLGWG